MTSIQVPATQIREALNRGHAHGISVVAGHTVASLGGVIPDAVALVVFGDLPGTYAVRLDGLEDATGQVTAMPVRSERTTVWVGAHL